MEYTEEQIEEAARKLCVICEIGPDELVVASPRRKMNDGLGMVELCVHQEVRQWYIVAQEIKELLEKRKREKEIISLLEDIVSCEQLDLEPALQAQEVECYFCHTIIPKNEAVEWVCGKGTLLFCRSCYQSMNEK